MEPNPFFHLVFQPNIALVSTVRRFIEEFYRRVLSDQKLAARLALATHELLENAINYAADHESAIRIDLEGNLLTVRTWNRSTPERIAELCVLVDDLANSPDPDAYYQDIMLRSLANTEGSGLGLARVRAEAEMDLTYEIDSDRVCICATTTRTTAEVNA